MRIETTNHCCSLAEIGYFDNQETPEILLKEIKYFLQDYLDDWEDIPVTFFATTRNYQKPAEIALKTLGFTSKKFKSRHDKGTEKSLTFWMCTTIPVPLRSWFKKEKARMLKEREKDDIW